MSIPVDVLIYVNSFIKEVTHGEEYFELLADFGIQDKNKFESLLTENITAESLSNLNKFDNMILTYDQFLDCMQYAVADYHIEILQANGLVESFIDQDSCELMYKLTDQGMTQKLLNNISYN